MKITTFSVVFLFSFLSTFKIFAQASQKQIEKIIVKSEKIEKSSINSSNSIIVITKDEIESMPVNTISDILQSQLGVYITGSGNLAGVASLKLRGTLRGQTKIMVDDHELNDASDIDNSFQINMLNIANIERIEILKGSQSTIYGGNSIGGVVKIYTNQNKEYKNLKISYGSYNTKNVSFTTNQNLNESTLLTLSASSLTSDGISSYNALRSKNAEKDGISNINFGAGLVKNINDQKFTLNFRAIKSDLEIDNSDSDLIEKDNSSYNFISTIAGYENYYFDKQLKTQIKIISIDSDYDIMGKYPTDSKNNELKISSENTYYINEIFTLLAGLDVGKIKSKNYFDFTNSEKHNLQSNSQYLNILTNLNLLTLDSSIRRDKQSNIDDILTYKQGLNFGISPSLNFAANYATGFKAPTIYQIYAGEQNKDLKATESEYFDFIIKYHSPNQIFEISAFRYNLKNMIDYKDDHYINQNNSNIKGIELSHSFKYNFVSFKNSFIKQEATLATGKKLSRTPDYIVNNEILYQKELTASLNHLYIGDRQDSGRLPSYSLINASVAHHYAKVTISNLLNKKYEDIRNYGTKGRSFSAEINYDF